MRLFVGIALADTTTAELMKLCATLRRDGDGMRWSAPESWHVTLQFLGNATPDQFACLKTHLAGVRSGHVPVRLGGLDVFERAGAFVVEVKLSSALLELQERVLAATGNCGFAPEERAYHPHITLARAKGADRKPIRDLKTHAREEHSFSSFLATEFLLYESHLGPGGAKYEVRARFPLT